MSRTAVVPVYLLPSKGTLEKYGLTHEEWLDLWHASGGRCPICAKPFGRVRPACVDHRHIDGLVRGLICGPCNTFLGENHDNAGLLWRAGAYLITPPAIAAIGERFVPDSPGAHREAEPVQPPVLGGEPVFPVRDAQHHEGPVKPLRGYASGKMTNVPFFNFPLFEEVTADLRAQGILVDSPVEHDRGTIKRLRGPKATAESMDGFAEGDVKRYMAAIGTETEALFAWDFRMIAEGDAIFLLPGWETSTGARHERYVAEALGKTIYLVVKDPAFTQWVLELDEDQTLLTDLLKLAHAGHRQYQKAMGR